MDRKSLLRVFIIILILGVGLNTVWNLYPVGRRGPWIKSQLPSQSSTDIIDSMGPLKVDPLNPRYFQDGSGKAIFLTGSHTWDNRQDLGTGDFDWLGYLNDLEAYGHNFIRFWVWEEPSPPNGSPNLVDLNTTLKPEIWLRTGPGIANDGGLKFDLTQFNQDHFDRLRQRVVEAGDRGIYVSIMLFNGWSVAQKSGGADPWPNHPFNSINNINGIDGDPNNYGNGYETENLSNSDITMLQEAYVRHVIDSVNDLDNVMYEISNEPDASVDGTLDWVNHMIDYIHAYEAQMPKQHPVWFTVLYPDGNNADLFASSAEAISPNNDVSNDGAKVVIPDTDHYFGIGGDTDWAWRQFASGTGGVVYMDCWNNLFLDCSNLGHPDQNFRSNLGYIRNFAERMNLAEMTPRSDLCSTQYCLANPSANGAEYLIYLPSGRTAKSILLRIGLRSEDHKRLSSIQLPADNQVFVDLSASPIELAVEWFNPEDGSIYTGQTIMGGNPSQSFSAPFSVDAVLYLYGVQSPTGTETPEQRQTSQPQPTARQATETAVPSPPRATLPCVNGIAIFIIFIATLFFMAWWSKS